MTLYTKETTPGGKVRYLPYSLPNDDDLTNTITFDEAECLTAAGTLGCVLLGLFEKHYPSHKLVARKIAAVESAMLNLYSGTGKKIDPKITTLLLKTWDQTMLKMSQGVES
jgi:hypothetical protein